MSGHVVMLTYLDLKPRSIVLENTSQPCGHIATSVHHSVFPSKTDRGLIVALELYSDSPLDIFIAFPIKNDVDAF